MIIIRIIRKINDVLACVTLAILSILVILQVIYRYALGSPLTWTEEIARYLQIWMIMLGSALVMRKGGHLAIDLVTASLPKKVKRVTDLISQIAVIFFFSIVFYYGIFLAVNAARQTSPATKIPMSFVYAALPVGSALLLIEALIRLVRFLKAGTSDTTAVNE
jgi:TRAP-type C4-dicarboxylate transport system permease small subunit